MANEPGRCEAAASAGLILADERGRYFAVAWADLERFRVPDALVDALAAMADGGEPAGAHEDVSGFANLAADDGTRAFLEAAVRGWGSRRVPFALRRWSAWELLRA